MLPQRAFRYYKRLVLVASSLNLFPYSWKWDKKQQKFIARKTLWSQIKYWTQNLCLVLYEIFMFSRFWSLKENPNIELTKKFGPQYLILSFIALNYHCLNTMLNGDMLPLLINSFVQVTNKFGDSKLKSSGSSETKDKVSRILSICVIPGIVFPMFNILGAIRRPEAPLFLTSLASEPRKLPTFVKLSYAAFHGYLNCMQYGMAIFHITTVICYVEAILPMIGGLSFSRLEGNRKTPANSLKNDDIYHAYHQLTCVQRIYNRSYSFWALAAQVYIIGFSIANIFQAVALGNRRGIFAGSILILLGCVIFKQMAHVYESSTETLHSWKDSGRSNLWFNKFRMACRPFRISVGPLYYADYTLVLGMLSVIFVNSVNMIVTYKGA